MMRFVVIAMVMGWMGFFLVGSVSTHPTRKGFSRLSKRALICLAAIVATVFGVRMFSEWGNIAAFLETRMSGSTDPVWGVILAPMVIVVVTVLYGMLLMSAAEAGISVKKTLIKAARQ